MKTLQKLYLVLVLTAAAPVPALAHAHLVTSSPAVGDTVATAGPLKLTFSEGIEIGLSRVDLTGPDGRAVADTSASLDPTNNKVVLVKLKASLPAGVYTVHWHVVSVDTHRTEGTYGFTVKP